MKTIGYIIGIMTALCFTLTAYSAISGKTDGEFITMSGTVTNVQADWFHLETNGKKIIVEMDDYDWDADGYKLVKGDKVVVSGRVDKDFLEKNKIEAGSVYVKGLDTYFFASSADEEGAPYLSATYSYMPTLPDNALVDIQGKVTEVSGREFKMNTGLRTITVEIDKMSYNPLDKIGFTKISKGDRVRVSGKVDDNFFEGKEIEANLVTEIY